MKLNLGCGNKKIGDCVNVDIIETEATDRVADCINLDYPDNSVEEIQSYHLIEHLDKGGGYRFVKNCHRMLETGGKIIIECPELKALCQKVVDGIATDLTMKYIFGNQRNEFNYHWWGYCHKNMKKLLEEVGFTDVVITEGTDGHQVEEPCMRIEAIKSKE